ncbi:hypothetical protein Tco_1123539 [Tanacetum coccineum]|uniref:Eukaryotic translation initiation factor 3 subunit G N-terminal domain-containing protein n=1 Tax=Tanacetum coccineum TaxID=301880 RepID=A0ABQ5J7F1_9ASTR
MQEVILFYNRLGIPTRQILDSRGAIPSKTVADAKVAIQEMAKYSQKCHNGTSRSRSTETSDGLAAIQAQLNNLGREIKKVNEKVYVAQVRCEQCKRPHYTKDCPLKEEGKTLEEALRNKAIIEGFVSEEDDDDSLDEREELCEIHELSVCNLRRFEMIKYSFGQDEEYVAVKEDEYDDLERTSEDACRAYQEIFRMMDEGWMVTRAE